jgi:hypothetical protein
VSSATINILEGVAAALIMLIVGAALKHWLQTFRESIIEHLKPVKQLERNGGSHLADVVYDIREKLETHLDESADDHERLVALEERVARHIRRGAK